MNFIEKVENRTLCSVTAHMETVYVPYAATYQELVIDGSSANDIIDLNVYSRKGVLVMSLTDNGKGVPLPLQSLNRDSFVMIQINGREGDDVITAQVSFVEGWANNFMPGVEINGGAGNDTINASVENVPLTVNQDGGNPTNPYPKPPIYPPFPTPTPTPVPTPTPTPPPHRAPKPRILPRRHH